MKNKVIIKNIIFVFCFFVFTLFRTDSVIAADVLVSGTDGTLSWSIDTEGHLIVKGKGDYKGIGVNNRAAWIDYSERIKSAEVQVQDITNARDMFYGCYNMTTVDFSGSDTNKVTDMSWMFDGCSSLTSLNLRGFNTKNVESMQYMFGGCSSLKSLDLTGFNTSKVKNMSSMFLGCLELSSLKINSFDTSNVVNMYGMFCDCKQFSYLDLSHFKTAKVEEMSHMFYGCSSLKSLDLSNFNLKKIKRGMMGAMFDGCDSLLSIKMPANVPCDDIELPLIDGCYWTDTTGFAYTEVIANLPGSMLYTRHNGKSPNGAKEGTAFDEGYVGGNYKVTFCGNKNKLPEVDYWAPIYMGAKTIKIPNYVTYKNVKYKVTGISDRAFKNHKKVQKIEIGAYVKTIGKSAFEGCPNLKTVVIGKNVTTIGEKAFRNCKSLTKVTNNSKMLTTIGNDSFEKCTKLQTISLGKKLKTIGKNAFKNCSKLSKITIESKQLIKIQSNAFKGVRNNCKFVVPKSKASKYTQLITGKGIKNPTIVKK